MLGLGVLAASGGVLIGGGMVLTSPPALFIYSAIWHIATAMVGLICPGSGFAIGWSIGKILPYSMKKQPNPDICDNVEFGNFLLAGLGAWFFYKVINDENQCDNLFYNLPSRYVMGVGAAFIVGGALLGCAHRLYGGKNSTDGKGLK